LPLVLSHQIVNLSPLFFVLVEVVDIISFVLIDSADDYIVVFFISGLVSITDYYVAGPVVFFDFYRNLSSFFMTNQKTITIFTAS
jgi:hypothetical protein